jgi:hypothetical protein
VLEKFNMADCKPVGTPMVTASHTNDSTLQNDEDAVNFPYRQAVGCLMWLAIGTRPDIMFAVTYHSQFLENPQPQHVRTLKRVFQYLQGTKDLKLTYGGKRSGLEGYTDADRMSSEQRKAISGYVFLIDGGAVSWRSRKQEIVSTSTTEAEYVATTHAAKEALYLRQFITELFRPLDSPLPLQCDNQGAIALAHADVGQYHSRTKHIDIRYHFIRQNIQDGFISLQYCPTEEMVADILTKPLPVHKVRYFVGMLGLIRD